MRIQLGMALAGGLLLALASPPGLVPGLWILLPLGLALLFEASRPSRGPRGILALYLGGALYLLWVGWSLRHLFYGLPLILVPGIGGLYWVLLAWMWRRSESKWGLRFQPWILAVSWVVVEWARAEMPEVGYPHSLAVLALYRQVWLLQPIAILGITGLTLLLGLMAAGLWALMFDRGRRWTRTLPMIVSLALWCLCSLVTTSLEPQGKSLRVALMQPNTPTYPDQEGYDRFKAMKPEAFLREFIPLARSVPPVDLFVWPESFAPRAREKDLSLYCEAMSSYLGPGTPILFGTSIQESTSTSEGMRRNVALLLDGKGKLIGRHEKRLLVPLGEAIPLVETLLPEAGLRAFHEWILASSDWPMLASGRPRELLQLEDHRISTPICYENAFASFFRDEARRGAGFFCVLSFENWYRQGAELDQLLALSVMGAIEAGRPVLRCTNDGITAQIDERGRILRVGNLGQREVLIVDVQAMTGANPSWWVGRWLPWILSLAMLLCLFVPRRKQSEA